MAECYLILIQWITWARDGIFLVMNLHFLVGVLLWKAFLLFYGLTISILILVFIRKMAMVDIDMLPENYWIKLLMVL